MFDKDDYLGWYNYRLKELSDLERTIFIIDGEMEQYVKKYNLVWFEKFFIQRRKIYIRLETIYRLKRTRHSAWLISELKFSLKMIRIKLAAMYRRRVANETVCVYDRAELNQQERESYYEYWVNYDRLNLPKNLPTPPYVSYDSEKDVLITNPKNGIGIRLNLLHYEVSNNKHYIRPFWTIEEHLLNLKLTIKEIKKMYPRLSLEKLTTWRECLINLNKPKSIAQNVQELVYSMLNNYENVGTSMVTYLLNNTTGGSSARSTVDRLIKRLELLIYHRTYFLSNYRKRK